MIWDARFRRIVIALCAIFCAVSALIFAYQVYSFFEKTSEPLQSTPQGEPAGQQGNRSGPQDSSSPSQSNELLRGLSKDSPPFLVYSFFGMVVSGLACIALIYAPLNALTYTQPAGADTPIQAKARLDSAKARLMPDARRVIELLEQNSGEQLQSDLVEKSGMNKLKVSRIIRRLESAGLVKKHPYGMTNLVVLQVPPPVEKQDAVS